MDPKLCLHQLFNLRLSTSVPERVDCQACGSSFSLYAVAGLDQEDSAKRMGQLVKCFAGQADRHSPALKDFLVSGMTLEQAKWQTDSSVFEEDEPTWGRPSKAYL